MQFDERDLGKDDNNNPQFGGESQSISWEELLKSNKETGANGTATNAGTYGMPKDDKSLDLASLMENKDKNNENNEQKKETASFDLRAAANNYVNSIKPDEAGILPSDNSGSSAMPVNNVFGTVEDELLLNSSNDEKLAGKDLSNMVDDELLSLLDDPKDTVEQAQIPAPQPAPSYVQQGQANVQNSYAQQQTSYAQQNAAHENKGHAAAYDAYEDMEYVTEEKRPKKSPILLVLGFLVIGIGAVAFGAFNYFGGMPDLSNVPGFSTISGIFGADTGDEDVSDKIGDNQAADSDINAQKQAQELVNKVDAENAEKADKDGKEKTVVHVATGGRINPFVPSALFDESGNFAMDASLSVPPDVDINSPEVIAARKLLTISVTGIMYDPEKPSAILKFDNMDYFVQNGDKIDTYTVKQITKEYVAIANGANIYRAYVGESFKIDEYIPASNQMQMRNGRRQYISANDVQISTK